MLLEFYDYDSSHYLEYETDEILIDKETIEQRDIRIRQEVFNEIRASISNESELKQITIKIMKEQWTDTKCKCGYCFSKSYPDGYYDIPLERQTKYCPNCGQALKWD